MKVFISYSRADTDFVNRLCKELELRGVSIWRDVKDIQVGDSIIQSIQDGIKQSNFFLLVLSKSSVKKKWVLREYQTALNKQLSKDGISIKILPVLKEGCEIPELLRDIKYADFSRSFFEGFESFCKSLKLDVKRKTPYLELIRYIESKFDSLEKFILKADKGELSGKLSEEVALSLMKLFWEGVEASKTELEEYRKTETSIIKVKIPVSQKPPYQKIQVIVSKPVGLSTCLGYDFHDNPVPVHGFDEGYIDLIRQIKKWRKLVISRKIFVFPIECVWAREGEDNGFSETISFKDLIKNFSD